MEKMPLVKFIGRMIGRICR